MDNKKQIVKKVIDYIEIYIHVLLKYIDKLAFLNLDKIESI